MTFAVNVSDLLQDEVLARILIAPLITDRTFFHAEPGRGDGLAVPLDVGEEQFVAVVETTRLRYDKNAFRFYRRVGSRWVRV